MKCTYYRPHENNLIEWDNIIGKLRYDLQSLGNEQTDEFDVYCYFHHLSRVARPLTTNSAMCFFGFDDPNHMPSDIRCEYFYLPSYLATAFMIKSVVLYPSLMDENNFLYSELDFSPSIVKKTLGSCLLGCTGRNLSGHGYSHSESFLDYMNIFISAGTSSFLNVHQDICPEFAEMWKNSIEALEQMALSESRYSTKAYALYELEKKQE